MHQNKCKMSCLANYIYFDYYVLNSAKVKKKKGNVTVKYYLTESLFVLNPAVFR